MGKCQSCIQQNHSLQQAGERAEPVRTFSEIGVGDHEAAESANDRPQINAGELTLGTELVEDEDDLEEGDHISAETETTHLVVQHHGIVVMGEKRKTLKVINFGSNSKDGGLGADYMKEQSLSEFRGSSSVPIIRITYGPGQALPVAEVVKRAKRLFSEPWVFQPYNARTNNCEHFATYCKSGVKRSTQSELSGFISVLARSWQVKGMGKWKGT